LSFNKEQFLTSCEQMSPKSCSSTLQELRWRSHMGFSLKSADTIRGMRRAYVLHDCGCAQQLRACDGGDAKRTRVCVCVCMMLWCHHKHVVLGRLVRTSAAHASALSKLHITDRIHCRFKAQ
jgi:hypothetical protein